MQIEFLKLIYQGGMVSIIVAAMLLAMSIGSWTLMIVKAFQLRRLRRQNTNFVAALKPVEHQPASFGNNKPHLVCGMIFDQDSIKAAIATLLNGQAKPVFSPYARLSFQGLHASEQSIAPLFLRKIFPGILLEKSVKMTRRLMPLRLRSGQASAAPAPAVLLHSPHLYVTSLRNDWTRCRNALQFHSAPSAPP